MKFGIFYEPQLPLPWDAGSEHQLFKNALEQVELADRLDYDYAWEVEHHFLAEYSHSSAPEVLLAAASQRTRRIRLGHGIMQLTTNHPARGLIGSPETIRRTLRKFQESHVDQVILLNQSGRTRHEDILSSLELFARAVMPELLAREPEQQEWKRGVLAGQTWLEEIDTAPFGGQVVQ